MELINTYIVIIVYLLELVKNVLMKTKFSSSDIDRNNA
jgi:hypothetical protein